MAPKHPKILKRLKICIVTLIVAQNVLRFILLRKMQNNMNIVTSTRLELLHALQNVFSCNVQRKHLLMFASKSSSSSCLVHGAPRRVVR